MLNTSRRRLLSRYGATVENETTDSPNGAAMTTAVTNPARPVVRIRIQPRHRCSQPKPVRSGAASSP